MQAPKRASKQQQQLNVDQFKLLKKPMDHLGKQLNVPGSFWQGRMSEDDRDKIYKCTIVDFSLAHKFAPDSSPRKAFKMQEMGIDGTGSHEESDLASTMYWIGYPMPFLRFFYDTFPAVDGASAGAAVVVEPERAGGNGVDRYLLESFPLHFTVFKQTACHLAHEANVEKVFSRAGLLADSNLLPAHLSTLVMVGFNKKAFKPQLDAIKDKYYEMFRSKSGKETRV